MLLSTLNSEFDPATTGGFAWNVAGGYGFTPNHAIEGGFMQNYASYEFDCMPGVAISTHVNVIYLAWRGTVPIKDRFAFFGKAGGMLITHPLFDDGVAVPYTGLGVSYAVTPTIDITVQYQGALYVIAGAGALTVGATYHF